MAPERSSLMRLLEAQVRRRPTRLAVWDVRRGRRLSYGRLRRLLDDWHALWALNGIRPGDRGLLLMDGVEFVAAYLAGLTYGLTVIPADRQAPRTQLRHWVARFRPAFAIASPDQDTFGLPTAVVEATDLVTWRNGLDTGWLPSRDEVQGAVILVTAGSTGSPKAVRLEVSRLLYAAQAVAAHHALTMRDRGFSPAPLFRVNGQVAGLLAQLLSGGTILLDHRFHAAEFAHIVRDTEPTWINAVPVMLAALAADRRFSLPPSVRFVRSSSAPLPHAVRRQFEARVGPLVLETYELTEAAGQVAANPLSPRLRRGGSVGRPVATRIRIVDDVGCDLKPYQEGAVVVAGPQVVTRYLSATGDLSGPDAAWLTTGDRGYRDTEGFLYVVGRAEEVGQASAAGSSHFEQRERRERPLQALG